MEILEQVRLKIHDITSQGWGVGRIDNPDGPGMVVFVPGLAPDEEADVRITEKKSNYSVGEIVKIEKESVGRRKPPCPYFGVCPGCSLQFIDYKTQFAARVDRVKSLISRSSDCEINFDIIPSPEEFGYRTHISITYECKDKHVAIGFIDPATRRVVDIPACLLIPDWSAITLTKLRNRLIERMSILPPTLRLRIFFDHETKTTYIVPPRGPLKRQRDVPDAIYEALRDFPEPVVLKKRIGRVKMRFHPASFSQANYYLTRQLFERAIKYADAGPDDTVLDLYSGSGYFTLAVADTVREAVALEADKRACDNLQKSATDLVKQARDGKKDEPTITIVQGPAESLLDQVIEEFKPTVIIANPPRSGLHKNVTASMKLVGSGIRRIVMVSCDASTCARDIKSLSEAGFKAQKATLVDCYPQTAHMETVVLLER